MISTAVPTAARDGLAAQRTTPSPRAPRRSPAVPGSTSPAPGSGRPSDTKRSGVGREPGTYGIDEFVHLKLIRTGKQSVK